MQGTKHKLSDWAKLVQQASIMPDVVLYHLRSMRDTDSLDIDSYLYGVVEGIAQTTMCTKANGEWGNEDIVSETKGQTLSREGAQNDFG